MKEINKFITPLLLLLASCASTPPENARELASSSDCIELVQNITNGKYSYLKSKNLTDDSGFSVLDNESETIVSSKFGSRSDKPENVKEAYRAYRAGRMSLGVLNKLDKEYPNLQGSVSALIYKDVLNSSNTKDNHISNGKDIIKETLTQFQKKFSYIAETENYYIIDIPLTSEADARILGELGADTDLNPYIFVKGAGLPSNNFYPLPNSVYFALNKKVKNLIKKDADVRYGLTTYAEKGLMSFDAFKKIALDFNGKSPIDLVFSIRKETMKGLPDLYPNYLNGRPEVDIEQGFEDIQLKLKFKRINDSEDAIRYQITLISTDELNQVSDLFMIGEGRINLP